MKNQLLGGGFAAAAVLFPLAFAPAEARDPWERDPAARDATASDFGGIGLFQTRTARFAEDGRFWFGASLSRPYGRYFLSWQALPWLEATFSYATDDRPDREYLDKSFDLKIRLAEESRFRPQVALALQDVLGTGLFGGEYLVASKRFGAVDTSLGLAWGYGVGGSGPIGNPFRLLSDRFDERSGNPRGDPTIEDLFSGPDIDVFAGLEYRTPIKGVSLKLEYDPNDYREEYHGALSRKLPFNFGLSYRFGDWLETGLAYERGTAPMARLAVKASLHQRAPPNKPADAPPPSARRAAAPAPASSPVRPAPDSTRAVARRIFADLPAQGLTGIAFRRDGRSATVVAAPRRSPAVARNIGRAALVVAVHAPDAVEEISVVLRVGGIDLTRVTLSRFRLEEARRGAASPEELLLAAEAARPSLPASDETVVANASAYPRFSWSFEPKLKPHLGVPEDPFLFGVMAQLSGAVEIDPGLNARAVVAYDIYNNFGGSLRGSKGTLPHVRTDLQKYLQEGPILLTRAQADHVSSPMPDWFLRAAVGYLEWMFGGASGEILYRRQNARWALGMEIGHVWQRAFEQGFGFQDYNVTTGHASAYFQLPWHGLNAAVHAGRYLAGDWGGTLMLTRRFESGVEIGGFFSMTNVSAEDFGEGGFDKGLIFRFPLNAMLPYSTRRSTNIVFRPLTSDGGQMLDVGPKLYGLTSEGQRDRLDGSGYRLFE